MEYLIEPCREGSQYLLNPNPLPLQPLPLQTLPFQFLSLHLKSLSLSEEVLPFFALPVFVFGYFPSPWGEKRGGGKWNIRQRLLPFTLQPIWRTFNTTCAFLQLDGRAPSALASFVPSSSQTARCPRLCREKDAACSSSSQTETDRRHKWTTANW